MDKQKIFEYIDAQKENMIDTLCELISYPSYQQDASEGAPFGKPVRECLDKALSICEGFGFKTHNYDGYAGTAEFTDGEPILGILGHLDVVPEGTGWTYDPFKGTVADGKVYGRGSIDDKGPCVAVIYALKALKDLGIPLKKGVRLIMGTNEENGSADLEYFEKVAKMPKWLFTPDGNYPVINIEKGMIRAKITAKPADGEKNILAFHSGKTINAVPELGWCKIGGASENDVKKAIDTLKSDITFTTSVTANGVRIDAKGVSAHASTPEMGHNALTGLLSLLKELNLDGDIAHLLSSLNDVFPHGETDGTHSGIKAFDDISGGLTEVLSVLDYDQGNDIDGYIDIRFPICENVANVSAKLESSLNKAGFAVQAFGSEPHYVDTNSTFVKELLSVYEDVTGERGECIAIGGGTYVHHTEGGVAFGAEFPGEDNHMHGADEFMTIDSLLLNAKIFACAIERICNSDL